MAEVIKRLGTTTATAATSVPPTPPLPKSSEPDAMSATTGPTSTPVSFAPTDITPRTTPSASRAA